MYLYIILSLNYEHIEYFVSDEQLALNEALICLLII